MLFIYTISAFATQVWHSFWTDNLTKDADQRQEEGQRKKVDDQPADPEGKVGPGGKAGLEEEASLGTGREKEPGPGARPEGEPNPEPKGDAGPEEKGPVEGLLPGTKEGKITALLRKQREILAKAMEGYNFHPKLKAK